MAWGLGPVAVASDGADPRYLHQDATGSVTAVTDAVGGVVGRAAYDPYGALRWSEGSIEDGTIGGVPLGFAGEQLDAETGLYFLRARYYDPAWGRFTQPDPAGWVGGAGHESTYLYAGGSPLDRVDPTGLRKAIAEMNRRWIEQQEAAESPETVLEQLAEGDLTVVHTGLDILGMVPTVGVAADLLNAGLSWYEGDHANAVLSGAAVFVDFATLGRAGARFTDELADGAAQVSRGGDEMAELTDAASDVGRGLDFPNARPPQGLDDVVGRADPPSAGGACRVNSFVPGTLVLMADGSTKAIEDIELGDAVRAVDPETGEEGPRRVTDLITGFGDKTLVEITIDGETVVATDGHPIWVDSEGRWVDAEDVRPGDLLLDDDGVTLVVDDVEITDVTEQRVHNLTVADIHTFFVQVGDESILTHNCGGGDGAAPLDGSDELLGQARRARDELAAQVGPSKATVTAGYDPRTGRIAAGCNSNPIGCAEQDVARQLGIPDDEIRFTEAIRPRTGEQVPICAACQGRYDPDQFPEGTLRSEGPWSN